MYNRKDNIISLPNKLPMLVKPKPFSKKEKGGYLLNDVKYNEDIIIDKNCYALNTLINKSSGVYNMINHISSVPFKINVELLDFILNNNINNRFLLDVNKPHKFDKIKRSKYQESVYKAYNSKIILQETILAIVEYFKDFSSIYFPVRADQRGRLYCMPHYFNYQSNELSKALLLFVEPGIIKKSNISSINYLKIYGANCYGLSKKNNEEKIK